MLDPYQGQVPYQGLTANPPVVTFIGGLSGVLGQYDEAEAQLERGAALSDRGGMRYARTYADLLWGRLLLDQRRPDWRERARELLGQARSNATASGYALLERRAAAALSELS
jgi:hypothetical protein